MPEAAGGSPDVLSSSPDVVPSPSGLSGGRATESRAPATEPRASANEVDVLVVDDDPRTLSAVAALLTRLDARPILARSGEEALRTLLGRDVALILLDVQMPGLSGLETAALIRSRERNRWTPIIFLTAHVGDAEHLRNAYALGAVDFLTKPVEPEEALRAKVSFFIELHRRGERLRHSAELLRAAQERDLRHNLAEAHRRWEEEALRRDMERERKAVDTLHRANERLKLLAGIREDLLSARNVRDRLPSICARISAHLALERWAVWLAWNGALDLVAHAGVDEAAAAALVALDSPEAVLGPAGLRAASGGDGPAPPVAAALGVRSCVARPCLADGRAVAALAFGSADPGACDSEVVTTLEIVADGLAMALERDRLFAELQLRNDALAEADRRKDQFLAMLGHELRNPLAPVLNAVRLLRDDEVPPETRRHALEAADRQVRHMARLVDDLLDVNRIRSGKVQLRKGELDLGRVVESAVQSVEGLFRTREHALELALPPEPLLVEGDPLRLTQVAMNLLTNAAKYTDPGGHVNVRLERAGAHAVLTIQDDGIGMPPELLPRVFDLFVQAEQAVDRSRGGLGIGLALVKSLVEMHGGSVTAESDGPGKGSRFRVRLPLASAGARAPVEVPVNGALHPAAARWQILVVEDNEDIRVTLAELLRRRGHHVEEAEDGESALALAETRPPDVALVDIGLPTLDGFAVARRLRELSPATRLVAMTGYGSPDDRRRSVDAGFGAHLVKPVDIDELTALLAQLT